MDRLNIILSLPLDIPSSVTERAEKAAEPNSKRVGYLQAIGDDIALRVFAFRKLKGKSLEITEVMRRITQEKRFIYKNLYGGGMSGYRAVYKREDKFTSWHGYPITLFYKENFDLWQVCDSATFGISYALINADMLKGTSFKYCGYTPSITTDIIDYLNEYINHPSVEFFGKLNISFSPTLVRKAEKDKAFRNWLYKTKIDSFYGSKAIIYAYENNISLAEAEKICLDTYRLNRRVARIIPEIKGTKLDRQKTLDYINSKGIAGSSYSDFLKALKTLKCDLTDTKNIYPHDFKRWHDIRIDEYYSKKAELDKKERAELYAKFAEIAQKYLPLAESAKAQYIAIIAKSPAELVKEGDALHHCVGRMGYDQKFVREESLIFFIRSADDAETPLATVEYSPKKKQILQFYADHNSKPDEAVTDYVNNVWLPHANKALKKLAKIAA